MQGKAGGNSIRLEQQFGNSDSVKIIRRQVEKYEKLAYEQTEQIERKHLSKDVSINQ